VKIANNMLDISCRKSKQMLQYQTEVSELPSFFGWFVGL